ncbi:MAG: PhoU domain-containing protein [Candidatus Helarchaeota archaeon]
MEIKNIKSDQKHVQIETRRVQLTGGASFIITLPKVWISKHHIGPKDELNIIIQHDDTLLITPKNFKKQTYREKKFDIDRIKDSQYLFRLLIGAYMMGYSIIIIESKKRIMPEYSAIIQKFIQSAIGLEIMDESLASIKIKDLIDPTEMPFKNMTNRIYIKAKEMLDDSLAALINNDKSLAENIVERDDEVDRIYWLIARQSNLVLRNLIIAKELGIKPEDANFYYFISRIIERIGDHAANIAKHIPVISNKLGNEIIDKLIKAGQFASDFFTKSIDVWNNKDTKEANNIIESSGSLNLLLDEINSFAYKIEGEEAISLNYVVESIRRIGDYSINICELTINRGVILD